MSRFSSFKVAKSGFSLLRKNRTLAVPHIAATVISFIILAGSMFLLFSNFSTSTIVVGEFGEEVSFDINPLISFAFFAVTGLVLTLIFHIAESTVISYALDTFKGKKTSTREAYATVRSKIKSIALFALLSGGIATLLSEVADKLPFAGKLTAWIAQGAWSIASAFAIPVIVSSDEPIGAIEATKKSVRIIKNSFGENVKVSLGLALISIPLVLGWIVTSGLALAAVAFTVVDADSISATAMALPISYAVVSGIVVISIMAVITGVTRAALYHYVETGKAPDQFEKDMFKSMITEKKARRIFGKSVSPF